MERTTGSSQARCLAGNVALAAGPTGRLGRRASRQAQHEKNPPGREPGGFFAARWICSAMAAGYEVVPPRPCVREERGERRPADDVRPSLRALAVPDSDDARKVGCDLDAATVRCTATGLTPGGSRQVGHDHSSCSARYLR